MKKSFVFLFFSILIFAGKSEAVLINFDNLPELTEGDVLSKIGIVTFKDAILAKVDSEGMFAFLGDDKDDYATEPFDEGYFITNANRYPSGSIEIGFDVPVYELSFVILDLDIRNHFVESLMVTICDANGTESHRTFFANDANYNFGDGKGELVLFDGKNIDKLVVYGNENSGWGIDNLSFKSVKDMGNSFPAPEPAPMLLLGSGLIAMATIGRRKLFKRGSGNNKKGEEKG